MTLRTGPLEDHSGAEFASPHRAPPSSKMKPPQSPTSWGIEVTGENADRNGTEAWVVYLTNKDTGWPNIS